MSDSSEVKGSDRRGFLRRLFGLTASAGIAGLLADRLFNRYSIPPVQASGPGTALTVDVNAGTGVGTTQLSSSGNPAFLSTNTGSGAALQGTCTAGTGVFGTTTVGTGVQGTASSSSGVGVQGFNSAGGIGVQATTSGGPVALRSVNGRVECQNANAEYRLIGNETNGRSWALMSDGTSFNFIDRTANQNLAVFATDAVTFTRRLLPSPAGVRDLGIVGLQWNNVVANGFVTISHSSMKTNITEPEDLDYLEKVPQPIYYKLKQAPDERTLLGFMGDELPEIAKVDSVGVSLNAVIGILCGAVKQLELQNEQLLKRVEELESSAS